MDQIPIARAVREYAALEPRLRRGASEAIGLLTKILDEVGINYLSVTGRAKALASFAAKASREKDGAREFSDPINQIGDLIGVRVITYVRSDVAAVVAALGDELTILDDRDLGEETASEGRFGYASRDDPRAARSRAVVEAAGRQAAARTGTAGSPRVELEQSAASDGRSRVLTRSAASLGTAPT